MSSDTSKPANRPFRTLSVAITIVVVLLALGLIREKWGVFIRVTPATSGDTAKTHFFRFVISMLTPALYNCALLATATVFGRMDKGGAFNEAMTSGLREIGAFLMLASASTIIFTPSLNGLLDNDYRGLIGVNFNFGIEGITVGLLGLMLVLLANRGRALKSELEQFV